MEFRAVMPPDREDRDRSIGGSMDWQILNIVSEALSPTALMDFKDWFPEFSGMAQSVLIFLLVLTFGAMMLECFSGFRLGALERFLVGFGPGSVISLMILTVSYEYEEQDALLYALAIGAIFGVLNVLLNRVFLFAAGFVAGNALIRYLEFNYMDFDDEGTLGIGLMLAVSLAMALFFALFAKKLPYLFSAIIGGCLLGLMIGVFVPYEDIPYASYYVDFTLAQTLFCALLCLIGFFVQKGRYRKKVREEEEEAARKVRDAEEKEAWARKVEKEEELEEAVGEGEAIPESSVQELEENLVEKARELAKDAAKEAVKIAENARLQDRFQDVEDGLYAPEIAAQKLGLSKQEFLDEMRRSGFALPGEKPEEKTERTAEQSQEGQPQEKPSVPVKLLKKTDQPCVMEKSSEQTTETASEKASVQTQDDKAETASPFRAKAAGTEQSEIIKEITF